MPDDICGVTTGEGHPCQNPASDNGFCWIPSHNPGDDNDNPSGRDPKLTQERQEKIAQAIEQGKSMTSAARMSGISKATLYNWLDRGEGEEQSIYAEFFDRITRARGEGEDRYVSMLFQIAADEGDTATLMSMLKQRYPETWGDVDRGEQAGGVIVNVGEADEFEVDPETLEVTDE